MCCGDDCAACCGEACQPCVRSSVSVNGSKVPEDWVTDDDQPKKKETAMQAVPYPGTNAKIEEIAGWLRERSATEMPPTFHRQAFCGSLSKELAVRSRSSKIPATRRQTAVHSKSEGKTTTRYFCRHTQLRFETISPLPTNLDITCCTSSLPVRSHRHQSALPATGRAQLNGRLIASLRQS